MADSLICSQEITFDYACYACYDGYHGRFEDLNGNITYNYDITGAATLYVYGPNNPIKVGDKLTIRLNINDNHGGSHRVDKNSVQVWFRSPGTMSSYYTVSNATKVSEASNVVVTWENVRYNSRYDTLHARFSGAPFSSTHGSMEDYSGSIELDLPIVKNNPSASISASNVVAGSNASVKWSFSDADGDTVSTANLVRYYKASGSSSWTTTNLSVSSSTRSYSDAIPSNYVGGQVYYRLGFKDTYSNTLYQNSSTYTVAEPNIPPTTPGIPDFDSNLAGGNEILVRWTASTDENGETPKYQLQVSLNNGGWTDVYKGTSKSRSYIIPNDTTSIAFRVRAYDGVPEYSSYATSAAVAVNPMPTNPGIPTLPDNYKEINPVTISWVPSSIVNEDSLTYELQASLNNKQWIDIYSGSQASTTYTIPFNTRTITFRVRVYSAAGVYTEYVSSNSFMFADLISTSLGAQPVGTIVKLNINGYPTNFIVVHQGNPDESIYDLSCNGTWLLMENIYNTQLITEAGSSSLTYLTYPETSIGVNLTKWFENLFDEDIKNVIKQVSIPYVGISSNTASINNYSTKIFLLSETELGYPEGTKSLKEGSTLDYFNGAENSSRTAYLNGSPNEWLTRSFDLEHSDLLTSYMWVVNAEGAKTSIISNRSSNTSGVRPALILPSTLFVSDNGGIMIENPSITGNVTIEGVQKTLTGNGYININGVWKSLVTSYRNINGLYIPIKPIYKWEKYALASMVEYEMYLNSSTTSISKMAASTTITYASNIIFNKTTGNISLSNPTTTTIESYYTDKLYSANKYLQYKGVIGQVNSVTYNQRTGYAITYYKLLSQQISDNTIGNFIEYTTAFDKSSYPADAPFTDGYWYKKCFDIMPSPTMTINDVVYEFEDGMRWIDWINSSYNTGYNEKLFTTTNNKVALPGSKNWTYVLLKDTDGEQILYTYWIGKDHKYSIAV